MISINGPLFTETLLLNTGVLLVSLLIIRVFAIKLRSFIPIFLILSIISLLSSYYFETSKISTQVVSILAGFIALVIATGLFAKLKTSAHYETLLVGVAFYPWYLGWRESIIYILSSVIIIIALIFAKRRIASKTYFIGSSDFHRAEEIIKKPEDLEKFNKLIKGIYTTPVALSALFSVLFYSINF